MSNLLVFAPTQAEAQALPLELAEIVERHPARVLLLVGEPESASEGLQASVSAVCHLAGGGRRICSEHVTLAAAQGAEQRLPSTARSLLIGDLPTALWWTAGSPPLLAGDFFTDLAEMSDHVIWDSATWADSLRSVSLFAEWVRSGDTVRRAVSDLAWRRSKPWRIALAEGLDPGLAPKALASVDEVVVEHGPHGLPQAWLLVGWLASRLGWRPVAAEERAGESIVWRFVRSERGAADLEPDGGEVRVTVRRRAHGAAEVAALELGWPRPGAARGGLALALAEDGGFVARPREGNVLRLLPAHGEPRALLVARQLAKRGRDPVYREALAASRRMVGALTP